MSKLKIEVGKRYLNGNGIEVEIIEYMDDEFGLSYIGVSKEDEPMFLSYTETGSTFPTVSDEFDEFDLVSEASK